MTTDVFDAQIVLSKSKVVTYQNVKEEATAVIWCLHISFLFLFLQKYHIRNLFL